MNATKQFIAGSNIVHQHSNRADIESFKEFLNEKQILKKIDELEMKADVKAHDEAMDCCKAHRDDVIPHPDFLYGHRKNLSSRINRSG